MSKWEMVRLGDLLNFQPKSKIKAGDGSNKGKYKFFTSSALQTKWIDIANHKHPSLIFGTGGNASVHFCNEPFSTSTDCLVFTGVENNLRTIYLYLHNHIHVLENGFKGSGLKHISKDYILQIQIPMPPIDIQIQIATTLDNLTEQINLRKQQLAELDNLIKSVFYDMFGDPVANPMGWKAKRLDQIATARLGKMLDAKKQTGKNTYSYLANFNVQWFRFDLSKLNSMDFDELDRNEFSLQNGDLLICEGGEVGRTAIWRDELQNCYFQKALHRVRCNFNLCVPEYISWAMYFKAKTTKFDGIISVSTIAHLTGEKLKALKFLVPPIPIQQQFANIIRQIEDQKTEVKKSIQESQLLFDSLMSRYFE